MPAESSAAEPSTTQPSPTLSAGAGAALVLPSSLRMTPSPAVSASTAPTGVPRFSPKVSAASTVASPRTTTGTVSEDAPAGNVAVPDRAV